MGKSCANTIKRNRQNVAIATQVLNPSAIGGSLRGQRALKHFGPPDDDEEEFFMYQRRAAWKKIGTYGLAIIVIILILMGIILCIGYIQTKKNDDILSSRSVQLIQERKPFSYIYTSKTTPDPPSLEPTDSLEFSPTSHSSLSQIHGKQDDKVVDESDTSNNQHEEFYYPSLHSVESSNNEGDEDYTHNYNSEDDNHHHNFGSDIKEEQNQQQNIHRPDNQETNQGDLYQDHEDDSQDETRVNSEDKNESINTTSMVKHDKDLDEQLDDKESVQDGMSDNNGDEKFSGIVEVTETIEEPLKGNKEYEELPKQGKVLPASDSVFSVEIPIYDPNKAIALYEDEDGKNVNAEKKELDSIDDDDDDDQVDVNEKPEDNTTTKTDTANESLTINVTPEIIDKHNSSASVDYPKNNRRNFVDNEPFHQAVLHTALFHLDEDKFNLKPKPVATAIIIEDQDFESLKGFNDQEYLDREPPYQSMGRNEKKMKILKNDRVMNMKATFTPPENTSKSEELINNKNTLDIGDSTESNNFNSKSARKPSAPRHRAKNGIQLDGENKTSIEWKLRLRKNKSENNSSEKEDESNDNKYTGQASSNNYENHPPEIDKFEDKPRLLSSSSFLPNFEDFLKTILTNVQRLNIKQNSGSQDKKVSPSRMASQLGINYANSINQIISPPSTLPTLPLEQDSSQFRKRTFNTEHDYLDFPPSNQDLNAHQTQNYFDHLLGQYPTVGAIGNPSAMGASLSNFYSPSFPTASPTSTIPQYDINPSSTTGISQYTPGIVPLDLASSFIQAGIPKPQQPGGGYGQQQQQYGQTPSYEFNNLFGGNFPQFPLPSVPKSEGIGTVTTLNGHPPTYNSISQGMQLFNLISGTVPSSYYHDQVYNPTTPSTPSSFQTDSFTVSPQFNFGSGSTTNSFGLPNIGAPLSNSQSHEFGNFADIKTPQSSPQPFLELHPFDYHHPRPHHPQEHSSSTDHPVQDRQPTYQSPLVTRAYALKSDRDKVEKFLEEDDHDQQSAASSFSRSIVTTMKRPKNPGTPVGPQQTTTAGSIITLFSKPKSKTASIFRTPSNQKSNPNSFSFEILPHKNNKNHNDEHPSANSVFNDDLPRERGFPTFDVSGSASKKKSAANPEKSWSKFSSHPNTVSGQNENIMAAEKYMPSRRKSTVRRIKTNRPNVGLKPGFYTR